MNNKNGHAVEYVHTKRATAQGKIASCKGHTITFQNGQSDHFSHLILCTGYEYNFPYLPQQNAQKKLNERYKLIFDTDDTSLLFIGYARPNIGSIPLMTELQCFYAFKVLSGKMTLPNKEQMLTLIQEDIENNHRYFYHKRRADGLVSLFIYFYDLAKLTDTDINHAKLFFESPSAFVKTFFSPVNAAHFLLSDKTKRQQAIKQIWSRQSVKWFIWPWIYLFSRFIAIDSILQIFTDRKYHKQLQKKLTKCSKK